MGKHRTHDKDYSEIKKVRFENQQLKRENQRLKKQLARIDLDRYSTVKDMIQEYRDSEEIEAPTTTDVLESMKKEWACREAGCVGHLEIILYSKMGETQYFRKCNSCRHRTKSQVYSPTKVRGPIKIVEEPK